MRVGRQSGPAGLRVRSMRRGTLGTLRHAPDLTPRLAAREEESVGSARYHRRAESGYCGFGGQLRGTRTLEAVVARWSLGDLGDPVHRAGTPGRASGWRGISAPARGACLAPLDTDGFEIVPYVLAEPECRVLAERVGSCGTARAGARNLLMHAWCRELALRLKRHFGIARRLPPGAVAVQCTLFDKSAQRNWLVALHQDLSVPVRERVGSEGCRGWSQKDGMVFVQPPIRVLEGLLAVRLHLDECTAGNGALRVVPGSHRHGRLNPRHMEALRAASGEVVCAIPRGGVLLMRPLLLHASSKALEAAPRRVLHFVFGGPAPPEGLSWALDG